MRKNNIAGREACLFLFVALLPRVLAPGTRHSAVEIENRIPGSLTNSVQTALIFHDGYS